ncbi:hypothetical protein TSH100_15160 [Azospirillum sp. TSH100]|uniref:hypothetical protein n=1 Tax=Azospirillum sp. TSH100 TaxID=652764 RepID=UPI000D6115E9|nr:hypothetical protein [Azospirillum sp. TSH100]PWC85492.1 hypothetical protein TSH100_15160 [Azospirillum sp. TSH100]
MTEKGAFLTTGGLLCFALCLVVAFPATAQSVEQSVAVSEGVSTVRLSDEKIALHLRTANAGVREVRVSTQDNVGCGLAARIGQDGKKLVIDFERTGITMRWWCKPVVTVLMPAALDLAIEVDNVVADVGGRFHAVDIKSKVSIIDFQGMAESFRLKSGMAIAKLKFSSGIAREAVALDVGVLLSEVAFDDDVARKPGIP